MIPARNSQRRLGKTRLMVLRADAPPLHDYVDHLPELLMPGDLLIINRSATLPSSFRGHVQRSGEAVEIRLASFQGSLTEGLRDWLAFSFGEGDWRMPTEDRGPPPLLQSGDRLIFGTDLTADILQVEHRSLLRLRFQSSQLEASLYQHGTPIQYSYLEHELAVWDQQTVFAGPPISTEAPSAAFPFSWDLVQHLKKRGVTCATVLHGAGLSSTGSTELDQLLPLAEYFEVPAATVEKVIMTRARGGRVIALGTSALRALESASCGGVLQAARGLTRLHLDRGHPPRVAQGLITGMHESGSSHRELLAGFLPEKILIQGDQEAEERFYRSHEYGDICLIIQESVLSIP